MRIVILILLIVMSAIVLIWHFKEISRDIKTRRDYTRREIERLNRHAKI